MEGKGVNRPYRTLYLGNLSLKLFLDAVSSSPAGGLCLYARCVDVLAKDGKTCKAAWIVDCKTAVFFANASDAGGSRTKDLERVLFSRVTRARITLWRFVPSEYGRKHDCFAVYLGC